MTSLVNPAYNSTVGSPTDQVNANTTTAGLSVEERDPLQNEINKMMKESLMDSDFSQTDNKNEGVSIQSAVLGGSAGKSRSKYASTDYSSMGIGNPLENLPGAYSDDDYDDDEDDVYVEEEEEDRRLTVADDNILRERNKVKAEAMFAGIDFIDDGEDEDDSEDEEEEEDDDEDQAEVVIIEEVDSADEKAPKRVKTDDSCSPKDPDADLMSPDEVIATKLGGILSYYANLEALTKQRSEQIEDDTTSLRGSVSDSSDIEGERHEGLYEMPQQPTPFDSGPSTMDDESTDDCESTYDMLYKSFGLRTQEETFKTDLLSPSQGQHDHGYASETSADERVSPIKRPGMLVRDGFKPPLSALTEDLPLKILSPTTEAESGIEVTPEPKSSKPLLDKELSEAQKNALTKPTTLPPGWREVADAHGTYYWHVPTGTTQWSPPSPTDSQGSASPPKKPAREQKQGHSSGGTKDQEQDPNLKEFQKSTLRYANLKLGPSTSKQSQEPKLLSEQNVRGIRFHVRSLGWVEMEDADLSPGKSSLAVNNCIRQLSYRKNDIRDTAGIWGEGKDMYMVLEDEYLKLTDPNDSTILNSQHVCSIRVWGVGRDNGRERDFAYVARDKVTKRYKCHVFRCDIPAKAIANALHEICAKVMSERQKGNTISMVTQGQMIRQQQQQQLMQMKSISLDSSKDATHTPSGVDFPTPKMEPITVFRANYVGSTSALKQSGMDVLNDAIDKVVGMVGEDQWTPVRIEVAVSTVTVTSVKTKETVAENRIRFMSFLGIGKDSRHFAYIMCIGKNKFQCHVFTCEHSAGGLAKAVEAACKLRYQKCLDANPKGSQVNAADGKTWGCALKTGIQSIFTKFGTMRIQGKDAPISAV
ncbi:amyloid-beta A4 precursor protein-binding family B member 2-like isoform X2 [Lytechinus variegatus]|uniref:amyloid-beta A4 precursor protein-binding family B member 2-like isoform X2 n=1 Tax=Lytechinus variegatus TaxID=7654 RepID=UPI001BB0F574|nr:amyloid-beta A4 precursor protein-binding family B member 2-like isoform X2 [Lytechinus variegatus]